MLIRGCTLAQGFMFIYVYICICVIYVLFDFCVDS